MRKEMFDIREADGTVYTMVNNDSVMDLAESLLANGLGIGIFG